MQWIDIIILITNGLIYWGLYDIYKLLKRNGVRIMVPSAGQEGLGTPVVPRFYEYNVDRVQNMEDVREFIRDMNLRQVIIGDQNLGDMVRRPEMWTEMVEEEDATDTNL